MTRKSYDQRLKEKWLKKEQKKRYHHKDVLDFYGIRGISDWTMAILPFLFGKRSR